jgi:hypothetical protein
MLDRNAAVYWRRRFTVLLIGLAVLYLIGWAITGVVGGSRPVGHPEATRSLHRALVRASAVARTRAATGLAAAEGPKQYWLAAAGKQQSGPAAAGPKPSGHAAAGPTHSGLAAARAKQPGHAADRDTLLRPCRAGDVVLSVFASRASYPVRQAGEFDVDVVSTASRSCTFDLGARHLFLRISAGISRVWSSAECAAGQASLVARLHRGVPKIVAITWNGRHSSPGCPASGQAAAAGTYAATATATGGVQASSPLTFRLG